MTPKKAEDKNWAGSQARKLLFEDIINGHVTNEMKPRHVRALREEYQQWEAKNFGPNLRSLRSIIARDYARMKKDREDFLHDMEKIKAKRSKDTNKKIPWHKSNARVLLNALIDEGAFDKD